MGWSFLRFLAELDARSKVEGGIGLCWCCMGRASSFRARARFFGDAASLGVGECQEIPPGYSRAARRYQKLQLQLSFGEIAGET